MPAFPIPRLKTPLPPCQSRRSDRTHFCNAWLLSSFRLPGPRHARAFASSPPLFSRQNRNHYKTLDVSANADKKELKKQFYRLSKRYHPDKNPGDADAHSKFVEINESYTILSDAAQRRAHDNELRAQASSSSSLSSPFASNSRGGFRRGGTAATRNTTRDPLRPDDWILYRRQASAKNNNTGSQTNPGYDYAKHQEEHYGAAAAEKRERNRQSRLFKTLYYQKLQEAQRFEGEMMAWVSVIGLGLFFVFHSGLIQMIWLDDEEVKDGGALWIPGELPAATTRNAAVDGKDAAGWRPLEEPPLVGHEGRASSSCIDRPP
ncbi:hypothetical protein HDU87_003061 [Geranomyces variabilis]|uniref:J domain-containing protein n=1 Tax=Geranomyces variabilis TaxID=109894 RepID=A0AAD5TKA5_9FUNG|nr:hypothetical protein HDU87_003061 [Geranomyces variabilis]